VIEIPRRLRCNIEEDADPRRHAWLARLPEQLAQLAASWSLVLGEPLLPGGQCAWVAPARDRSGRELVLKAGWRHPEAEQEADALRPGSAERPDHARSRRPPSAVNRTSTISSTRS
jgi:streptomycin 6-kinase